MSNSKANVSVLQVIFTMGCSVTSILQRPILLAWVIVMLLMRASDLKSALQMAFVPFALKKEIFRQRELIQHANKIDLKTEAAGAQLLQAVVIQIGYAILGKHHYIHQW